MRERTINQYVNKSALGVKVHRGIVFYFSKWEPGYLYGLVRYWEKYGHAEALTMSYATMAQEMGRKNRKAAMRSMHLLIGEELVCDSGNPVDGKPGAYTTSRPEKAVALDLLYRPNKVMALHRFSELPQHEQVAVAAEMKLLLPKRDFDESTRKFVFVAKLASQGKGCGVEDLNPFRMPVKVSDDLSLKRTGGCP